MTHWFKTNTNEVINITYIKVFNDHQIILNDNSVVYIIEEDYNNLIKALKDISTIYENRNTTREF